MSAFPEFPRVPAERSLPAGRLELRRAELVRLVEAERAAQPARRRRLRTWLASLVALLALAGLAGSGSVAAHDAGPRAEAAVATAAALGAGPVALTLSALPRVRPRPLAAAFGRFAGAPI